MTDDILVGGESHDEPVDPSIDTTNGQRDPLTTDDGLTEAAAGMPQLTDPVACATDEILEEPQLNDLDDLDVTNEGCDPCAEHGEPGPTELPAPWREVAPGMHTAPVGTPEPRQGA